MKANLTLERIGGTYGGISPDLIAIAKARQAIGDPLFSDGIGIPRHSDWVAEIVGSHPVYRYERRFLHGKPDYARANARGTRGVYANYILESGHIYEVNSPQSWRRALRYFVEVTEEGDIVEIDEMGVVERLKNRQGSAFFVERDNEH